MEIARRSTEHVNRTGEPLWEVLDPEIEWIIDPIGLLAGTYRGHEGIKQFLALLRESFDELHLEIDDVIDAGDSVVMLCRSRTRGRSSGMTVEQPLASVSSIRFYFRSAEALEAVGLSEQDVHGERS